MKRESLSKNLIGGVYLKSNGKCFDCDKKNDNLHIHHVIPVSQGGSNEINNLILLCKVCHRIRHNKIEPEIYNSQKYLHLNPDDIKAQSEFMDEMGWEVLQDGTDHFAFRCPKCKNLADISSIKLLGIANGLLPSTPCFH